VFGTKGAPITRTGDWSLTGMIRLSAEAACSTRAVVRSASRFVSTGPSSVAPPAIAALNNVTTASKTMLQFSSRILMPEKRGRGRVVPADTIGWAWDAGSRGTSFGQNKIELEMMTSIDAAVGYAFDEDGV
jgi:hypothetical protein